VQSISEKFESEITLSDAERFIELLGRSPVPDKKVTVDFSACTWIDVGAGTLIGNALRRYAQNQLLEVIVPPIFSEKDFSGTWFKTFTRSGLGYAIAEHAPFIISNSEDITSMIRNYYKRIATSLANNVLIIKDIHEGTPININEREEFEKGFRKWLSDLNKDLIVFEGVDISNVIGICYQGLQNIFDHSYKKPLPENTKILSYFAMRYYQRILGKGERSRFFEGYLSRISEKNGAKYHPQFVELVVNDDGVGIPARQSQRSGIYWQAREQEEATLKDALSGKSVKPITNDAAIRGKPGLGYPEIADCLRRLGAFASLRTGRILATFDGTVKSLGSGWLFTQALTGRTNGYVPGTMLQVLIPLIPK